MQKRVPLSIIGRLLFASYWFLFFLTINKTTKQQKTMKLSTTFSLLNLFGSTIPSNSKNVKFAKMQQEAIQRGFLVHPDLCNLDVLAWIESKYIDTTKTFFKSWKDIKKMSREEIWCHQITSYFTVFLNRVTDGVIDVYIPEGETPALLPYSELKPIMPISVNEVEQKIRAMICSGIALKSETVAEIVEIMKDLGINIQTSEVLNKEAKIRIMHMNGETPDNVDDMMRYLVFLRTNGKITMVIKDKESIANIKCSDISLKKEMEQFGLEKLASVFRRHKPLFMAMKRGNESTINTISRLAKKYHVPYKQAFVEGVLNMDELDLDVLTAKLKTMNNFKKVALMQAIKVRQLDLPIRPYRIRNGKLWVKTNQEYVAPQPIFGWTFDENDNYKYGETGKTKAIPAVELKPLTKEWYDAAYKIIRQSLVNSLKGKACKVAMPKHINLVAPSSEKAFVGTVPFGSWVDTSDENIVIGINRDADHCDGWLDFSLIRNDGMKIGWNTNFKDGEEKILFSGDINLPKGTSPVTELFYAEKGFKGAYSLKVNDFSGMCPPFKFFIAKEKMVVEHNPPMCQPSAIKFQVDLQMVQGKKMISIGVMTNERFIFSSFKENNKMVSQKSITDLYVDYALKTYDTYEDLKGLLIEAGYTISDTDNCDVDLSQCNDKSALIGLFS